MAVDQLLVSVVLAPAAGVVAGRILVDLLPPRAVAFGYTAAAGLFAAASTLSLVAFGMPAVARVAGLSPAHQPVVMSWQSGEMPLWASWACLLLVTVAMISVLVTGRSQFRSVRAARAEAAALPGTGEIVVIPDGRADAFALPGVPGRIVVTEGMLTAVGAGRHQALFAHERAHLAGRHHRFSFGARLAAAALPPLWPMVTVIDYAIERWADEQAASVVGDRRSVAHVVGTAALAATEQAVVEQAAVEQSAVVGAAERRTGRRLFPGRLREPRTAKLRAVAAGGGPRPGPVPRRVAALLAAPQRRNRLLLAALPAALALASCGVSIEALLDLPYRRVFDYVEP
ncbi:Peptidase family M48 [Parafrankia irregularis]|uniref:Peptidase family M48 n=1 Tax=Parafrankia irregularis TaxID=795642 RepID=A0A0S4QEP7_9ACTN|nr:MULTISPECIES: M48 family metalloprotease [Parafrankia]MBE3199412.1 M48 family metalloprotease [Parafrankia sp. CH37]MBE3206573.1 M48 family metalloprotease [Parafrankia sp. CH37]MBE3206595.1 M48 family metalloprotease [Parafrankia sp. CH37]CUU53927.1 Peptidase family M48 [Parafrankia irregularis]